MRIIRPSADPHPWIDNPSASAMCALCLNAVLIHAGTGVRIICISAPSASGSTTLANMLAKKARGLGKRVLKLDEAPFAGSRYLHAKLMDSLGVGSHSATPCYEGLSTLCAGILDLRSYDLILIEDAQRFRDISGRITDSNLSTLARIARLRRPPLIIMTGLPDAVAFFHAMFVEAGMNSQLNVLEATASGNVYREFIRCVCKFRRWDEVFNTSLNFDQIYQQSRGRIGLTVRILEWLHLQSVATSRAMKDPVYLQLLDDDWDEEGWYDEP
ncbi:hypothetical protein D3C77_15440 [compost metagenome]